MYDLLIAFLVIFLDNIAPVFAPPTWMILSFITLNYPISNLFLFVVVALAAATLGRICLALLSRTIIRKRLLGKSAIKNIDYLKIYVEKHKKISFSVFLIFAFTPFPTNYLFMAYGLTNLKLIRLVIPFMIGRAVSYSFWIYASAEISKTIVIKSSQLYSFSSIYFVVTQLLIIFGLYLFTKIHWKDLIENKKLKLIK